ncbi:MAG: PspA-associated protein PspAA [Acidimicrobiales bacterium]
MIVRILGEGQFDVPDASIESLNPIDEALVTAIESGDQEAFAAALAQLLDGVHSAGKPSPLDSLEPSDLVLPGADSTLEDVKDLLGDEGLIPG